MDLSWKIYFNHSFSKCPNNNDDDDDDDDDNNYNYNNNVLIVCSCMIPSVSTVQTNSHSKAVNLHTARTFV